MFPERFGKFLNLQSSLQTKQPAYSRLQAPMRLGLAGRRVSSAALLILPGRQASAFCFSRRRFGSATTLLRSLRFEEVSTPPEDNSDTARWERMYNSGGKSSGGAASGSGGEWNDRSDDGAEDATQAAAVLATARSRRISQHRQFDENWN